MSREPSRAGAGLRPDFAVRARDPSRGAPRAQREEGDDEGAGGHHAHLAAHDGEHDRALAALVELADRLRVLQPGVVAAPPRRRSPAAARRRTRPPRQQRVEPVEPVGGIEAERPRARPRRAPGRRAAPGSARHSTQNARDGSTLHQCHAPSTPATRLTRAAASATAWATLRHLPLSIKTLQMVVEPSPSRDAPLVSASRRLPLPRHGRGPCLRRPEHLPRAPAPAEGQEQGRPVRVRAAVRHPAGLPLRDQLLPDRDALHPVRHRGRLPLPGRRAAARVRELRPRGD